MKRLQTVIYQTFKHLACLRHRITALGCLVLSASLCGCGGQEQGKVAPAGGQAAAAANGSPDNRRSLDPRLVPIAQAIEQGRISDARVRLQVYLADEPNDGQAIFLFGLTFHRDNRYDAARRHFERAAQLSPLYHPIHHFLGWCLYYLGEPEAARSAFEAHLALTPDEGDSHFGIGLIDLEEDRLKEAEARFRAAIELQKDNPGRVLAVAKAHSRLGDALMKQGRHEEAREHLERGTQMDPDQYEALYQLYRVLLTLGEEEAAERALQAHHQARQRVRPE
ncbi:MAG TPA: tetratricopeptide repeat protein [Phycisphaerales bacterium]|nr:tetratricopeptide repeat protein [Phycisphaerales bacterium]